ncbi:MAG: 5-(carboxyamino)imidazole ribonucleotide mutase [Acidobacteriota bacterium]
MAKAKVGVVLGSDSDLDVVIECLRLLKLFGVPFEIEVASAHRSPQKTRDYARSASRRGLYVIIAAAGGAAHLPGFIASETTLPIIGIPIPSSELMGHDSLLSIAQMPSGVPVATMGIGKSGAANAAILAVQILSLSDRALSRKLHNFKNELTRKVNKASEKTKIDMEKIIQKL